MTKRIECVMTVVAQWPLSDSAEQYDEGLSDEQVMAEDKAAVDEDLITVWDLDADAKISYEWRIIDE
jgi:hypothetical protein